MNYSATSNRASATLAASFFLCFQTVRNTCVSCRPQGEMHSAVLICMVLCFPIQWFQAIPAVPAVIRRFISHTSKGEFSVKFLNFYILDNRHRSKYKSLFLFLLSHMFSKSQQKIVYILYNYFTYGPILLL